MKQPNLSVLNDVSRLPMKTAIHAGAKLPVGSKLKRRHQDYLTPSFIYRMQGASFTQLDIGLNYHVDPVSVGFWYRGKPFEKTTENTVEQDAIILMLGLYLPKITIGYSYDFTTSKLQTTSGGAHELSIVIEFVARPVDRDVKKKYKLIPCPTFNSKEGFWN
jgi:type IX secretion system PorP/SprF family membrane protein